MKGSNAGVMRILVVEDEATICELCLRTLVNEGFEVDIASNGQLAQDMMGGEDYDLCLIDIKMSVMNGKQLYQCIKDRYPKLIKRVIFASGDVVNNDTQHFLEQSGRPFLSKPFTPEELITAVREAFKPTAVK